MDYSLLFPVIPQSLSIIGRREGFWGFEGKIIQFPKLRKVDAKVDEVLEFDEETPLKTVLFSSTNF